MFRGSVKGTGYPLHSPVSPSLPLPCVTVCHHILTGIYFLLTSPCQCSVLPCRISDWRWPHRAKTCRKRTIWYRSSCSCWKNISKLFFAWNKNNIIVADAQQLLVIGKVKSVPLQAWSGPEGSRKLRFPDFMTTAQDGGKVVSLTHRQPLLPGNTPGTHFS